MDTVLSLGRPRESVGSSIRTTQLRYMIMTMSTLFTSWLFPHNFCHQATQTGHWAPNTSHILRAGWTTLKKCPTSKIHIYDVTGLEILQYRSIAQSIWVILSKRAEKGINLRTKGWTYPYFLQRNGLSPEVNVRTFKVCFYISLKCLILHIFNDEIKYFYFLLLFVCLTKNI